MIFGAKPSLRKQYENVVREIEEGERRTPQHDIPRSIMGSGNGFESFRTPSHDLFFQDFRWFQTILNRQVPDPWCVEELSDTLIRDFYSDSPDLGRRYCLYYNNCQIGLLQVRPSGFNVLEVERFRQDRQAWVTLDMNYLRFLPWDDVFGFLTAVHFLIGDFTENETSRAKASAEATQALTGHMWESMRVEDAVLGFDHHLEGPYTLVQQTTEHWASGGIDPIARWGGDRGWSTEND
jgi:hypothetical protein